MLRKTLSLLAMLALLVSAYAAPVVADEKNGDDKKADKDAVKKVVEEKAKDKDADKAVRSPIKKLVEIKLDPFLVSAKTLNIPLPGRTQTLRDMLERFDKLAKDDEVGAVLLNLQGIALSLPDVEELCSGLVQLKEADKKVFAFVNSGDPMSYLVACQADEIALAPTGSLVIPGLGRVFPYMRGMYQMQGIEFDVITAGAYKYPGFVNRREPDKYFLKEFGDLMDCMFESYVGIIADGRGMDRAKVKKNIDIALFDAEEAKNRDLVDVLAYYDDYSDRLIKRHKFEKARDDKSALSRITSLNDLMNIWQKQVREAQESYKAVGPKIAILNARGPIIDMDLGASLASSLIMRDQLVKTIEEIRKNKTIRAVVLRIDSPGGSGYASDVIWKKLRELDEEKPVIASMGTVAASGGYYIACPTRMIFAEPTTITGSIGVITMIANSASAINRADINLAEMKRGERSLFGSSHRGMKPEDRAFLQQYILDFYEVFLDRVAAGRKMPKDQIRKLAGGRIYTGRQALEIGLVDRLGNLNDAVDAVRDMADIPPSAEIKLVHYPRPASIGELIESLSGVGMSVEMLMQANAPAPQVSFDSQLRYFARTPQPLCWLAMPDFNASWGVAVPYRPTFDLLGTPATTPGLLPAR